MKNGQSVSCSSPVNIHGKAGRIEAAIIKGSAPLLSSRNTLRSLQAVLDCSQSTLSIAGSTPRPLQTNSAGQYVLNVLDQDEVLLCEQPSPSDSSDQADETEDEETETDTAELSVGPEREYTRREHRCLLAHHEAWQKGRSQCVVAELFSPPRFCEVLQERKEAGFAFDIQQGWDLTNPETQKKVSRLLDEKRPELLVCCPECKHWGGWYRYQQKEYAEHIHRSEPQKIE